MPTSPNSEPLPILCANTAGVFNQIGEVDADKINPGTLLKITGSNGPKYIVSEVFPGQGGSVFVKPADPSITDIKHNLPQIEIPNQETRYATRKYLPFATAQSIAERAENTIAFTPPFTIHELGLGRDLTSRIQIPVGQKLVPDKWYGVAYEKAEDPVTGNFVPTNKVERIVRAPQPKSQSLYFRATAALDSHVAHAKRAFEYSPDPRDRAALAKAKEILGIPAKPK